ncbi:hypothetical protein HDV00_009211 [Rhizophlyctis rosea]|nr:hypothetical protein HDV00_009211 [Rhizophlyctis rosea]
MAQFFTTDVQNALFSPHWMAFMWTALGSLGTLLGGILVLLLTRLTGTDPSSPTTHRLMGTLQAFSAGVMMYITAFDLIPESIDQIGNRTTMTWFFIGIAAFGILEEWILPHDHDDEEEDHLHPPQDTKVSSSTQLAQSTTTANPTTKPKPPTTLSRTSTITLLTMTLHALPEGLSIYLSSLSSPLLGLHLAIAIALHNIPEGMAVAVPLYVSTHSPSKVLSYTLISGLAKPAGVLIGGAFLRGYVGPAMLAKCLASVGGVMACISVHELLPMGIKFAGKGRASCSFFVGMGVCFAALEVVEEFFGGGGH